jgi:hypothetical protein
MSAPNAFSPSNVAIRSGATTVTGTNTILVLGNAAGSGHAYRILNLRACNTQITATTVTVTYLPASSTGIGTGYSLSKESIINGYSYIDILDSQHPFHLEENTSLAITPIALSSSTLAIDVIYSYEDIS